MATHDYIIDNSTGQNVRQDINNALAAIVSNNSNSSSPSTTYAYQWWADTSNNVLKIRNSANNAWIELLQLDGTLTLEDGSASTPALAFRDDLNTGIFSSAADTFDIATAGSKRLIVDSVGRVGIGNITPVSYNAFANTLVVATSTNTGLTLSGNDASANYSGIQFSAGTTVRAYVDQQLNSTGRMRVFNMANGFLEFGTNNEIRMHIKATGEVGIGTTSPSANLESEGNVSSTTQFSGFQGLRIQNANGAAHGVTADINFVAGTGSANRGAVIGVEYTTTASGNDLYFATNANAVASNDTPVERLRITSAGNVGIGTTSPSQHLVVSGTGSQYVAITSTDSGNTGVLFGDSDIDAGYVLYANSDDSLRIGAGTVERMRINSDGKIDLNASPGKFGNSHSSGTTYLFGNDIRFTNAGITTTTMTIDSSAGRVGIGTASPTVRLHCDAGTTVGNAAGLFDNDDNTAYSSAAEGHLNTPLIIKSTTTTSQSDQSV